MAPRKSNREHTVISTAASKSYSSKASSSKVSPKASPVSDQHLTLQQIVLGVWDNYQEVTPQRIRLVDVFLTFLVIVGVLQFIYCLIAGNYPFNAFLSGFSATVGQFVLTSNLSLNSCQMTKKINSYDSYSQNPNK
ncbi:Dolichyl-diphosphooligosaccharide--protein glycosyltransferase subunit dad-1 [Erysiphe necator]|nr:Dolichyl-diphosphooligosaccharide--protein glycosyltransferase subunit dad-1 [Erysiphe necator]